MTAAAGRSTIALTRARGGWRDRLRRYQVIIDGNHVASIRHGERLDLMVTPGQHTVSLRISWASSAALDVGVAPGEAVTLECAPGSAPPFGPGVGAYIELRRTSE